jgi:hypothetical protein
LLLTFLFGPVGFLVFWIIRSVVEPRIFLEIDGEYRRLSEH